MSRTRRMTALATGLLTAALATDPTRAPAVSSTGRAFFTTTSLSNLRLNASRHQFFADWLDQETDRAKQGWTIPARPLVHIDSGTNPNSSDQDIADTDMTRLLALALDAKLQGRAASLDRANIYLTAWARTYVPAGDPAAEQPFTKYVMGYELVRDLVPLATRDLVDAFLLRLSDTQVAARVQPGLNVTPWSNKWSMSAALTTAIAFLLHDPVRMGDASAFYSQQLQRNVLPAGSFRTIYPYADNYPEHPDTAYDRGVTLDFIQRDALLYHVTTISMLYTAALIAEHNGKHWFGGLTGRLASGYDFLVPYATGALTHVDFGQSLLTTDGGRQAYFDPAEGIRTLTVAAPLATRFRAYADLTKLNRDAQVLVCATYPPSMWSLQP